MYRGIWPLACVHSRHSNLSTIHSAEYSYLGRLFYGHDVPLGVASRVYTICNPHKETHYLIPYEMGDIIQTFIHVAILAILRSIMMSYLDFWCGSMGLITSNSKPYTTTNSSFMIVHPCGTVRWKAMRHSHTHQWTHCATYRPLISCNSRGNQSGHRMFMSHK